MQNQNTNIINTIPTTIFDGISAMLRAYVPNITNESLKNALSNLALDPTATKENYITRKEAAAMLKTSIVTIDRYVKTGLLKSYKVGAKMVRIAESSVNDLYSK